MPSGDEAPICKCGISVSNSSRKNTPNTNPTAAGTHAHLPIASLICMLGISSDHTLAATITPDAKPSSNLFQRALHSPRSRNTIAAPNTVPDKGNNNPNANHITLTF